MFEWILKGWYHLVWRIHCWDLIYYIDCFLRCIFTILFYAFIACLAMLSSPILIPLASFYLILIWAPMIINWLKERVSLTLPLTICGFGLGSYAGVEAGAMGSVIAFLMGMLFDITLWSDNNTTYSNQAWIPDRQPYQPYQTTTFYNYEPVNYGNGGIVKVKPERPWAWKGFQVNSGPKEDDLRKDLI